MSWQIMYPNEDGQPLPGSTAETLISAMGRVHSFFGQDVDADYFDGYAMPIKTKDGRTIAWLKRVA